MGIPRRCRYVAELCRDHNSHTILESRPCEKAVRVWTGAWSLRQINGSMPPARVRAILRVFQTENRSGNSVFCGGCHTTGGSRAKLNCDVCGTSKSAEGALWPRTIVVFGDAWHTEERPRTHPEATATRSFLGKVVALNRPAGKLDHPWVAPDVVVIDSAQFVTGQGLILLIGHRRIF